MWKRLLVVVWCAGILALAATAAPLRAEERTDYVQVEIRGHLEKHGNVVSIQGGGMQFELLINHCTPEEKKLVEKMIGSEEEVIVKGKLGQRRTLSGHVLEVGVSSIRKADIQ
jgi:hypothetical protein